MLRNIRDLARIVELIFACGCYTSLGFDCLADLEDRSVRSIILSCNQARDL